MPPRRPNATTATPVVLALVIGACRLDPPAMPAKDLQARAEEEATGRAARVAESQAEGAVLVAREAEEAAATRLRTLESGAEANTALRRQAGERYAQAIAEAHAGVAGCTIEVARLIALRRYLAEYESEPGRDAAIAALEPCRKLALKARRQHHEQAFFDRPRGTVKDAVASALRDDGLVEPWIPVPSGSLPTPGLKTSSSEADEAVLARARTEATAAAQAVGEAEPDLVRARRGVAASDARLARLGEAEEAREKAWRGEIHRSGHRYLVVAGATGAGALVGLGVGFFFIARGDAIESGKKSFETNAEREDASRRARIGSLVGFGVALPLAVVSIVAAHYGLRRLALGQRIAVTPGGLTLKF